MLAERRVKTGMLLGLAAVCLWSSSAAFAVYVGSRLGPWQFLAIACGVAGLAQTAFYLRSGMALRSLWALPWRLWVPIVLGFVLYAPAYTLAMVLSAARPAQAVGASLTNYLWPTFTLVFAVLWVPGTKASWRLAGAAALSLAGILLAYWPRIRDALADPSAGAAGGAASVLWPYSLALAAAICWAAYSAILARWRHWANRYATAPVGMLLVSAISAVVCSATGQWRPMDAWLWLGVCLAGLIPEAAGYMFWELALHRAPASSLGLLGAATPVMSTVLLLGLFAVDQPAGASRGPSEVGLLVAAALLIAAGVLLGSRARRVAPPEGPA